MKKKPQENDIEIRHYFSEQAGGFVTSSNQMREKGLYKAMQTHGGGAVLRPLPDREDDLAKVRFAQEIFSLLVHKKRRKDETVRQALERIIAEATSLR